MKNLTVAEFANSLDEIIDNALLNEEMTLIETEEGEKVVLMTEHQYNCIMESIAKKRAI